MYWSCQNVQDWVQIQCRQFNVQVPNLDYFYVPGSELCQWSEQDFKACALEAGQTIYSRLDIWRSGELSSLFLHMYKHNGAKEFQTTISFRVRKV